MADVKGSTALHRAVRRSDMAMTQFLIAHGADLSTRMTRAHTMECQPGTSNRTTLDSLIKAGADPNTSGQHGVSELYTMSENGEIEVIK